MRHEDAVALKGKVVLLDLVSGMQICTEVTEVTDTQIVTGKVMIFQIAVEPQDPSQPPHQTLNPVVQKVNAMPYGGPFIIPKSEMSFDLDHILQAHEPVGQIEKGYLQAASGIEIAGAGAIQGIKA